MQQEIKTKWGLEPHQIEELYAEEQAGSLARRNNGLRLLLYGCLLLALLFAAAGFVIRIPGYLLLPILVQQVEFRAGSPAALLVRAAGDVQTGGQFVRLQLLNGRTFSGKIASIAKPFVDGETVLRVEITPDEQKTTNASEGDTGQISIQQGRRRIVDFLF